MLDNGTEIAHSLDTFQHKPTKTNKNKQAKPTKSLPPTVL